jgi:hypothetical protein
MAENERRGPGRPRMDPAQPTERADFRAPQDLIDDTHRIALRQKLTFSDIVRLALRQFIDHERAEGVLSGENR